MKKGVLTAGAGQHAAQISIKELMLMKTSVKRRSFLILVLCIVLAAATVLCMAGCKKKESPKADPSAQIVDKGTGAKKFEFDVVHKNGDSKRFMIHTDKDTIGAALVEVALVSGANTEYGLMVDTVDGEKLDYTEDGYYWAFYIDGEYAMTGVDSTNVEEGKVYTFKAEAA